MSLRRGEVLYIPVHQVRMLFLLLWGRVRIYKVAEGSEITLGVVGAGEVFGEAALAPRQCQGAYAQAMEASDIGLMSLVHLYRLVCERPEVSIKAMELLSKRISFCKDRIADLGLKEVPARLAALVLHLCESEGVVTGEGYKIPTLHSPAARRDDLLQTSSHT